MKIKKKKYHTVGTFTTLNRKIAERDKIDSPNTQIYNANFSGLVQTLQ
jgi:hypothetical protein